MGDSVDLKKVKTNKQMEEIRFLESVISSRTSLMEKLGQSYGGDRDIYDALGYNKVPSFKDYIAKYRRHGISKRIVNAPVEASWRKNPIISDSTDEKQTDFEKGWEQLVRQHKIWHYLARADRLAGIGEYGVLHMGFDDTSNLRNPVSGKPSLIYLRPYTQEGAEINEKVESNQDPRYGMPLLYNLSSRDDETSSNFNSKIVHYTRVIHIAEGLESDDVYGTPRLESVLNDITDLEKVTGGSAEMFWRGAFPGLALSAQADAAMDTMDLDDLEDELQAYIHKLQRYIRLQGIDLQELKPQVVDPDNHFLILIQAISAATNIPKRILVGSERGELASSQDEINWGKYISNRRTDFCEPQILRPFIDTMIFVGILPEPRDGQYDVIWPDVTVPTEKDQAEVDRTRADILQKYVGTPGTDQIIPPSIFLKKYLKFTDGDIEKIEKILGGEIELELEDEEQFKESQSGPQEPREE